MTESTLSDYHKPVLRELGRMDLVTRKSGPNWDGEGQFRSPGDPPPDWLCQLIPFFPGCPGAGSATLGQRGSGSF